MSTAHVVLSTVYTKSRRQIVGVDSKFQSSLMTLTFDLFARKWGSLTVTSVKTFPPNLKFPSPSVPDIQTDGRTAPVRNTPHRSLLSE